MADSQPREAEQRLVGCVGCGGPLSVRYPTVLDPQSREHFAIEECTDCGLGHTTPQPRDLAHYYSAYHGHRHGFTARYCVWRRLRFVSQVMGQASRRALDVGCGDGSFMAALRSRGFEVFGTELNPAQARARGFTVAESVADMLPRGPFGLITFWQSLEHLKRPAEALAEASALLAPGGVLVAAVPDADSTQARLFGPNWFHLDVPRHLFHFGDRSLGGLFARVGLDVVRSWHHEAEIDLFGWSQSTLNALLPEPNLFFNTLTGRKARAGRLQEGLSFALGTALTAGAIPAVALLSALGDGGTLVMAARRALA